MSRAPDDAPVFTRGDRVRDPLTGKLGTHAGIGHQVNVHGHSRIVTLVHWDGTGNAVPCTFRLEPAPVE